MKELELNKDYSYKELEVWFSKLKEKDSDASWNELGEFIIGGSFIVIQNMHGQMHSFILTSYNSKLGSIYTLIFKD